MSVKILLIEDNKDSAQLFGENLEKSLSSKVIHYQPPKDIMDLVRLVEHESPDAVFLDHILNQHTDTTYLGSDAFELLSGTFPKLPIFVLTSFPHDPELQKLDIPISALVRKKDLMDEPDKSEVLTIVQKQISNYVEGHTDVQEMVSLLEKDLATQSITLNKNGNEIAQRISNLHFSLSPTIISIFWLEDPAMNEIRLIEINRTAIDEEEIDFFPAPITQKSSFPIYVADVSENTFNKIKEKQVDIDPELLNRNWVEFTR